MSRKTIQEKLEFIAPDLQWNKVEERGKTDVWQASKYNITVQVEIPYAKHNPFIELTAMKAQRMIEEEHDAKG